MGAAGGLPFGGVGAGFPRGQFAPPPHFAHFPGVALPGGMGPGPPQPFGAGLGFGPPPGMGGMPLLGGFAPPAPWIGAPAGLGGGFGAYPMGVAGMGPPYAGVGVGGWPQLPMMPPGVTGALGTLLPGGMAAPPAHLLHGAQLGPFAYPFAWAGQPAAAVAQPSGAESPAQPPSTPQAEHPSCYSSYAPAASSAANEVEARIASLSAQVERLVAARAELSQLRVSLPGASTAALEQALGSDLEQQLRTLADALTAAEGAKAEARTSGPSTSPWNPLTPSPLPATPEAFPASPDRVAHPAGSTASTAAAGSSADEGATPVPRGEAAEAGATSEDLRRRRAAYFEPRTA
ncbi:hypothetical protein T492DRAFT_958630, partial [Pavlovales sp. CCMP2436]